MTTYTTWNALMHYAKAVGEARKYGTSDDIEQAETQLSEYEQLVKTSDGMILPPYLRAEK
jgi:hypothetical protein